MDAPPIVQLLGILLGPAGAVWVSVRLSLNGTRNDVREIKRHMEKFTDKVGKLETRVAVLEDRNER